MSLCQISVHTREAISTYSDTLLFQLHPYVRHNLDAHSEMSVQTDRQTLGQMDGFFFYIYSLKQDYKNIYGTIQRHFFVGTSPIGEKMC